MKRTDRAYDIESKIIVGMWRAMSEAERREWVREPYCKHPRQK